jgi:hypothetical protein
MYAHNTSRLAELKVYIVRSVSHAAFFADTDTALNTAHSETLCANCVALLLGAPLKHYEGTHCMNDGSEKVYDVSFYDYASHTPCEDCQTEE